MVEHAVIILVVADSRTTWILLTSPPKFQNSKQLVKGEIKIVDSANLTLNYRVCNRG